MFDLGIQELIVIFIVALIVFGPKKLPEIGKTLGKGVLELKKALRGFQDSIKESEISEELKGIRTDITKNILSEPSIKEGKKPEAEIKTDMAGPGEDKTGDIIKDDGRK
ncbi:MAG: twin-arginine translocase TatA/TatE family subunit [Nitrospirae bacterium]|nr:twin-arginine translocase TatA/TatE family subunit [Nitrospirota bacterium]